MRPSEPITYAYWSTTTPRGNCLWHTCVIDVGKDWFTIDRTMLSLTVKDEGIVWIRGHHIGDPEGVALLAAFALSQGIAA